MGLFDVDEEAQQGQGAGGLFSGGLAAAASTASVVVKPLPGTALSLIPAPYQPHGEDELSDQEKQDLEACKAGVDNLRNAFWIAGKSFETMSTAKLHREENPNFAEWVWINWEVSESQLYRLIDEWRVGEALANLGHKPLESQVRKLVEVRRQTSDKIAITVYDTIARCVPRVTGQIVEKVVDRLGFLPKDANAADVGRRVRELLETPEETSDDTGKDDDVPDISSLGKDSPNGESSPATSNSKADLLATKDIERLEAALAALQEAAKKVNKAAVRRAVEGQPDVAVPLIQEIGSTLQQIDRAVAIRLPKPE
ncbi:hypothetical protein P1P75_17710 [Streptomyces sp. ID05-39B]|uniref:hypothetical protein n=1 Tax=Streptomyces sp. ID05-39B TaxID=3028664 RepID=UPI0029A27E1E|nr:hypothetical protein [Streptomyces sp. ID05-39B]MDX3528224.1 hypothetical protein [Streptomyces sp. ID05-39B]